MSSTLRCGHFEHARDKHPPFFGGVSTSPGTSAGCRYLKAYDGVSAARQSLAAYFEFYNARRPHQSHDGCTPDMVYFESLPPMQAAA